MIRIRGKFSRYAMYQKIETWAASHRMGGHGKVVGGATDITRLWPAVNWQITNYPEVNAMQLPWATESLDIIVSDQMLEHVSKPWFAAAEMIRVLKKGGLLVCTTCFMQRWHPPHVYFTFHMDGLKELFKGMLSEMEVGGWGNRDANDLFNHNDQEKMWRALQVEGNPMLERLVLMNDEKAPFSTWIMGVR